MKEKRMYLDGKQINDLEHGFEVVKVIKNIDCKSIKLTIKNNNKWGTSKP